MCYPGSVAPFQSSGVLFSALDTGRVDTIEGDQSSILPCGGAGLPDPSDGAVRFSRQGCQIQEAAENDGMGGHRGTEEEEEGAS